MRYIARDVPVVVRPFAMGFLCILALCSDNPLRKIVGAHCMNTIRASGFM